MEEWRGLQLAEVECNYLEIDRQLEEQFIQSLNDKYMLEEVIKELTATGNDDHITSRGVLAWAKRVEVQRAQTAVLNILTELRQFNKIEISKRAMEDKQDTARALVGQTLQWQPCWHCGRVHPLKQCPAYGKTCVGCGKTGHFKIVCCSRRSRAVNEIEVEMAQEYSAGETGTVSIDSVHMNKDWSLLTVELETFAGDNKIIAPYKIDTGSKGNIMPWHIFKRLFQTLQKLNSKRPLEGI